MSFVHPGYLWFLSLLALPVIIHLFYFRRHKRLYFPSLKYLKQQDQEKKAIKNLKRWLILVCRLFLFAALVIAFAQPRWSNSNNSKDGISITMIYIDNSYSMSAKGVEGTLLSESKEIAKRIILEGNTKTRYFLCSNALSGMERKIHSQATAIRFIDELSLNRTPRNLGAVLTFQDEYLNRYNTETGKIASVQRILLSDFQKKTVSLDGYTSQNDVFQLKTDALQTVPQQLENRTIDSVWTEAPVNRPGTPIKLFFRVKNCSDRPAENINITLQFDGKKRMTNLSLNPFESTTSYFNLSPQGIGYLEGKLSLYDPSVTWDDDFYFTHRSAQWSKILIIQGNEAPSFPEKAFATETFYETILKGETAFGARDLQGIDLVVLNELNNIPSGNVESIKTFVSNGGSVFILPSVNSNLEEYNALLRALDLAPFSGTSTEGNQVAEIRYRSLFFRGMFEKEKKDLNLPLVKKVYAQKSFRQSNAEILIELRNGLPLLLHQRTNGNVFLLTACPNEMNGGIARHALYPSMLLRAGEYSIRSLPMYNMLGKAEKLSIEHLGNTDEPVSLVKNNETFIPRQLQTGSLISLQLNTPELLERMTEGIYDVQGIEDPVKISINLSRDESLLVYMDETGVKDVLTKGGLKNVQFNKIDRGASSFNIQLDNPASFWEIFIILALVFAIVEMAVIKFMNP